MKKLSPHRLEKEIIKLLEEAFEWGCTDREAVLHAGICRSTLYRYIEKNPEFRERKELLKCAPVLRAKKFFYQGLSEAKPELCLKYLEKKCGSNLDSNEEEANQNGLAENIKQRWNEIWETQIKD